VSDEYPPIDPASIAPLAGDGRPDLYNNLPSRIIPLVEAKARGWTLFYDTSSCRYGHQAPRYVSNPRLCVDCHRVKKGLDPIGAKAAGAEYKRAYKQRDPAPAAAPVVVAPALEPDKMEKLFLEAYASSKNIDDAAKAARMTAAQVFSRMSYSKVFKDAVNALEDRLNIKQSQPAATVFDWTDAKRTRFVQVYVDTGDVASARDAIQVTPSEYYAELERNSAFADAVKDAEPLASKSLEEKAIQMALSGNDKLLTKVLSAKLPEYREKLSVDVNDNRKLTDQQIDNRLARLLAKHQVRVAEVVDAEFLEQKALPAPDCEDLL
jgi:glutaredoxin